MGIMQRIQSIESNIPHEMSAQDYRNNVKENHPIEDEDIEVSFSNATELADKLISHLQALALMKMIASNERTVNDYFDMARYAFMAGGCCDSFESAVLYSNDDLEIQKLCSVDEANVLVSKKWELYKEAEEYMRQIIDKNITVSQRRMIAKLFRDYARNLEDSGLFSFESTTPLYLNALNQRRLIVNQESEINNYLDLITDCYELTKKKFSPKIKMLLYRNLLLAIKSLKNNYEITDNTFFESDIGKHINAAAAYFFNTGNEAKDCDKWDEAAAYYQEAITALNEIPAKAHAEEDLILLVECTNSLAICAAMRPNTELALKYYREELRLIIQLLQKNPANCWPDLQSCLTNIILNNGAPGIFKLSISLAIDFNTPQPVSFFDLKIDATNNELMAYRNTIQSFLSLVINNTPNTYLNFIEDVLSIFECIKAATEKSNDTFPPNLLVRVFTDVDPATNKKLFIFEKEINRLREMLTLQRRLTEGPDTLLHQAKRLKEAEEIITQQSLQINNLQTELTAQKQQSTNLTQQLTTLQQQFDHLKQQFTEQQKKNNKRAFAGNTGDSSQPSITKFFRSC